MYFLVSVSPMSFVEELANERLRGCRIWIVSPVGQAVPDGVCKSNDFADFAPIYRCSIVFTLRIRNMRLHLCQLDPTPSPGEFHGIQIDS